MESHGALGSLCFQVGLGVSAAAVGPAEKAQGTVVGLPPPRILGDLGSPGFWELLRGLRRMSS